MPVVVGDDPQMKKRCTCRKCGAINEYVPGEVRILRQGTDYGGGHDGAEGFNCGRCGQEVVVRSW